MIAGCGGYNTVQDEGVALTKRRVLDFAGAGVTATDDAANARTLITIPGGAGAAGMVELADTTLAADAASIVFDNIDQSYTSLLLVLSLRSTRANVNDAMAFRIASSSSNLYYNTAYQLVATTVSGLQDLAQTYAWALLGCPAANAANDQMFGGAHIWFTQYSQTNHRPVWTGDSMGMWSTASGGMARTAWGGWYDLQSFVGHLTIFSANGANVANRSRATLYGLT